MHKYTAITFSGTNCELRPKSTRDLVSRGRRLRGKFNGMSRYVVELPRFSGSSYLEYRLRHEVEYNMTATIIFNAKQPNGEWGLIMKMRSQTS